jgi:hypothetical protein
LSRIATSSTRVKTVALAKGVGCQYRLPFYNDDVVKYLTGEIQRWQAAKRVKLFRGGSILDFRLRDR